MGKLLLIPNLLDPEGSADWLPPVVGRALAEIDGVIAESEKGARYFLKRFAFSRGRTFRDIPIRLLNEHTQAHEVENLMMPIEKGECWAVISDCGLPCLADPGSQCVAIAHRKKIAIEAYPGPSSILLTVMLSGIPAQAFAFHGYLPREHEVLVHRLQVLSKRSKEEGSAQLFIEAPYRNQKLLEALLAHLSEDTHLCAAWDLTMPSQQVVSQTVKQWKSRPLPDIHKKPCVFMFRAH